MRHLKFLFLVIGLLLFAYVLSETDLAQVWVRVREIGVLGVGFVLCLYIFTFLTDVIGWQLTFESINLTFPWIRRLYGIRMVGEAINNATPTASVGGEPIKAYLLKAFYRVGYTESSASLVLSKTTNLIGLVLFLGVGFALLFYHDAFAGGYKLVAGTGLICLTAITGSFFLLQRLQVSSFAGTRLGRSRFGARLKRTIEIVGNIDRQFHRFYAHHPFRFGWSVLLAVANWLMGIIEVYVVMDLLGYEVTLIEAWIIESMVQMVRAGTFFIPAGIGTQEAALLIVSTAVTGTPLSGVAYALVRRFRELVWIAGGLGLWSIYSVRKPVAVDAEIAPLSNLG